MTSVALKLKRLEKGVYATADGRYEIRHEYEVTDCECLPHLCTHAYREREVWLWMIWDTTLPSPDGRGDWIPWGSNAYKTLDEARLDLARYLQHNAGT